MLPEAGFFAAFLVPSRMQPSVLPILILRWMLFRVEMGAGLIKRRRDPCWRDLTCLFYHYETQPLPNPLSWYFHTLPRVLHQASALASHFIQAVAPFALFAPQQWASIAGGLIIFQQLVLIVSGNYSWLNWLTVVLGFSAFSDRVLGSAPPLVPRPLAFDILLYVLGVGTVLLSIRPTLNLLSRNHAMNANYNPFHLVNSYVAFGHVSRERYEIVIEGTTDAFITPVTTWQDYQFKGKPGDPMRMPPQVAPYHLRLDWMVWFLPFSVTVTAAGRNDPAILRLMCKNPFQDRPPALIRALLYQYRYTTGAEKRQTGAWWNRRQLGVYLEPVSRATLEKI